ncbi:RNA polymerase sigma factor [Motiliproteus sp. MSK22-1]|uniref:RNA polymerase sigma factor n=1 Tax=Motiliproteus sp. MSK22-1 TaxID=1897630 RepID=UPI00097680F8|nr:RNA polymerase sigma factor [Motiliproteus sp. MSK22-1]OMH25796.1 RNA polymerase subunit sigma-24 [Motiliproteus sp. MSK22-1]
MIAQPQMANELSQLYKNNSGKVLATLVRLIGDFDLAEEAMHEAFLSAVETWSKQGIPENPGSWLISTGRFKAIDIIRRKKRFGELQPALQQFLNEVESHNVSLTQQDIEDDQLRLIFICCHPAIDPNIQIPLTLREVCGLTTEEIASAFLVSPSTMAQRIVRGKNKIRAARIPFAIPAVSELTDRLDAVLYVIYLVFSEGYSASAGDSLVRTDLVNEAIRLARLLLTLLPDSEVMGLLALMLLHESRRKARTDHNGNIVLLEDQDRSLWNQEYIKEGITLIHNSTASRRFGVYTIQAAIAAVHAEALTPEDTDWNQVVSLYSVLMRLDPSPIIELNRAVAVAMRDGPKVGLEILASLADRKELKNYHLFHSSLGELLRRTGQTDQAISAFERAIELAKQAPEQRLLKQKIARIQSE